MAEPPYSSFWDALFVLFNMLINFRLLVAANKGHLETVRLLVAHGADVNRANCNENGPLWVASWKGHLEVVKLLLNAKAEQNKVNHNRESPVAWPSLALWSNTGGFLERV